MRTNLDSFVGTALASVVQSWQIHGKPVLRQASQLPGWSQANSEASRRLAPRPSCSKVPRETRRGDAGPRDKIQVNLEPGEHPITPPL